MDKQSRSHPQEMNEAIELAGTILAWAERGASVNDVDEIDASSELTFAKVLSERFLALADFESSFGSSDDCDEVGAPITLVRKSQPQPNTLSEKSVKRTSSMSVSDEQIKSADDVDLVKGTTDLAVVEVAEHIGWHRFRHHVLCYFLLVVVSACIATSIVLISTRKEATTTDKTTFDNRWSGGDLYPTLAPVLDVITRSPIAGDKKINSKAPSTGASNVPLARFEPSSAPSAPPPTYAPSAEVSIPNQRMIFDRDELLAVIDLYLGGQDNAQSNLSKIYGYPIGQWDVSLVEDFSAAFDGLVRNYAAQTFNEDISAWNTSSATDMSNMFRYAFLFNQDLSSWDVSSVATMTGMFNGASSFNKNISMWNVSNLVSMGFMFQNATSFHQNISDWDVSKVVDMRSVFRNADAFNCDVSSWNVSSVITMDSLFKHATNFNQNLCEWGRWLPSNAIVWEAFAGSACPDTTTTSLGATIPGPLCHSCLVRIRQGL